MNKKLQKLLYKSNNQNNDVTCLLCPHYCRLSTNMVGRCLARQESRGIIVPSYPDLLSSIAVEPIEKKPFKHWMAGTKTLSIGGYGCPLDCKFCENHSISQVDSVDSGIKKTSSQIIKMAEEHDCQSICMTYSEPTINFEYLMRLGTSCLVDDVPFLLKTNAYINSDPWEAICRLSPALNIDWKGSSFISAAITSTIGIVVENRIKEAIEHGLHIEISVPLYYSSQQVYQQMAYLGEFLSELSPNIPCHLLKITPAYKYLDFIPSNDDIEKAYDILSSYMDYVYK